MDGRATLAMAPSRTARGDAQADGDDGPIAPRDRAVHPGPGRLRGDTGWSDHQRRTSSHGEGCSGNASGRRRAPYSSGNRSTRFTTTSCPTSGASFGCASPSRTGRPFGAGDEDPASTADEGLHKPVRRLVDQSTVPVVDVHEPSGLAFCDQSVATDRGGDDGQHGEDRHLARQAQPHARPPSGPPPARPRPPATTAIRVENIDSTASNNTPDGPARSRTAGRRTDRRATVIEPGLPKEIRRWAAERLTDDAGRRAGLDARARPSLRAAPWSRFDHLADAGDWCRPRAPHFGGHDDGPLLRAAGQFGEGLDVFLRHEIV